MSCDEFLTNACACIAQMDYYMDETERGAEAAAAGGGGAMAMRESGCTI